MGYVDDTLGPDERYLLRAQFNWTYSVIPWFWALLGFAPLLYASLMHGLHGAPLGDPRWVYGACLIPAIAGAWQLIAHIIHLVTTEIAVTSTRFVFKTGLVSRDTKEVTLNNIEEINLHQSVLGRIFGFGHLTVRGTGVGVIKLPDLARPIELRRCIEEARAEARAEARSMRVQPTEPTTSDEKPDANGRREPS